MTHRTFVVALVLLAAACSKKDAVAPSSGILLAHMDTLVSPGDDFDRYVNGGWLKNNEIPADKSSYGVAEKLHEQAQENVRTIIEEAAKSNAKSGSNDQKIGDYYNAVMDVKARDAKGFSPLLPEFEQIDAINSYDALATYFGRANRMGVNTPFAIGVTQDFKDPESHMLYIWQSGIGLPEREYYLLTDATSKELREKYVKHIGNMLSLAQIPNAEQAAKEILALETGMAKMHDTKEQTRDFSRMYNPYKTQELSSLAPRFKWSEMLKTSGVASEKTIIVAQPDFVKQADALIASTPLNTWKLWLKWSLIHDNASALSTHFEREDFEFFRKALYGIDKPAEPWRRAVDAVNNHLGEIVGQQYVAKHFSPEAKKRMNELVENLLKAYELSIKELDWMTDETKKEALAKLSKFTPKVGYPDKWKDYSKLEVKPGDLFGNRQRAIAFEYERELEKLGKKVDRTEWGMTPQTVNAYYHPMLNEIVFPAAILQAPFFDLNVDDAVNYGSIGAVIGHEIGHGFDDQGSMFDGEGVLRNWWTEEDLGAFKSRTSALVAQFNAFEALPGLHVNGEYTLGENIGDLGGLGIALRAYKLSLNGKEPEVIDGFTGVQRFFIGYAQSWLSKQRDEYLRNQIASDPHSPAHFRVNGIVRNIPEFYEAFNVTPENKLYLAPENRVKIW